MQIGAGRQLPSRCGLGRRPPVLLLVAASPGGGASRGAASRRRRARRRRAANLPLLRRPRACGQTEWRRVVFGRGIGETGSPRGGMIWAVSHPPKRTGEAVSSPIRSGRRRYAAGTHPARIPRVSVSDTYPTRIRGPLHVSG